ncbi:sulfite exporter TauE/SafE family protein [Georgenia halophila]|uniref:Probable membrane transporter protein n=1 Tax=Georgenia halophila TaxID=620889 RepID=A0ABP8KSL4_9MICO
MAGILILSVVGLFSQLVDGSLGMGFGVISSTLLIAVGIAPAAVSSTVHLAKIGTGVASGLSHWKFGNVDWRVTSLLAVPGAVGAFGGAVLLSSLSAEVAAPWVSLLLFGLGGYVLWRFAVLAGARPVINGRLSRNLLAPLGLVGGALDSLGGGGWGPIGTTTLLSSGRLEPKKVVGSVSTAELVVALGSSAGFLVGLGSAGINVGWVLALLVGGVIGAPFAAWVVQHMRPRMLGVLAGGLIVITNTITMMQSWFGLELTSAVMWVVVAALTAAWSVVVRRTLLDEREKTRRAAAVALEADPNASETAVDA